MPYFLIALLVVATVFLLLGIIGRGVEAGSGTFSIKVEGKVGPFPRVVFLVFSAINYAAALVLFVALIGQSSPSIRPTVNSAGAGASGPAQDITSPPQVTPSPPQVSPSPTQVTIDISDSLSGNEYSETATVNIDGATPVTLAAGPNNPSPDQIVTLAEGQHAYQISVRGYTTAGYSYDFSGQGTLLAGQGNSYTVVYDANRNIVFLQPG